MSPCSSCLCAQRLSPGPHRHTRTHTHTPPPPHTHSLSFSLCTHPVGFDVVSQLAHLRQRQPQEHGVRLRLLGVKPLQQKQVVGEQVDGLEPPLRQPLPRPHLGLLQVELQEGGGVVQEQFYSCLEMHFCIEQARSACILACSRWIISNSVLIPPPPRHTPTPTQPLLLQLHCFGQRSTQPERLASL